VTPSGETVLAALPMEIVGGFGAELRRFVLALHAQGEVTTERLTTLLNGIGVEISKRQVVRRLTEPFDGFVAEDQGVTSPFAQNCTLSDAQGERLGNGPERS